MRHSEGYKFQPMLHTRQSPSDLESLVKRRCRQGRQQSKNGQARGPSANFLEGPVGDTGGIVVHAEDEGGNREYVALGEAVEDRGIFTRFVEAFFDVGKIGGVDRF